MKGIMKDQRPATEKEKTLAKMALVAASFAYGVDDDEIMEAPRGNERTYTARHTVYWLLRKSGMTYYRIGAMMGKDHAAALNGVKQINIILELNLKSGFAECIRDSAKYYKEFYIPHKAKEEARMRKEMANVI